MDANSNILRQFGQLDPKHIVGLSEEQMRSWLLALSGYKAGSREKSPLDNNKKGKYIHKTFGKRAFKEHIKARMPSIIGRSLKPSQGVEGGRIVGTANRSHRDKGGKSKFKSSTQLQADIKIKKFGSSIGRALAQTDNDELGCPICLELLVSPALTTCGHSFCYQCIDESLLFSHNCPNCRENIRGCDPILCPPLQKLTKCKAQLTSLNESAHYLDRERKHSEWRASRMLSQDGLQKGRRVDVRDTESIWCQGIIVQVYQKYDKTKMRKITVSVLVHYNRWHKIYNEIIDIPTNRLAPLSYFSDRVDIPHYNLVEEEGNVRGSVIAGSVRIEAPQPVQYIRIEESNSEMSDSFFSELMAEEDGELLSHLGPEEDEGDEHEEVEESSQNDVDESEMDIREYVNHIRRNVLMRLSPDDGNVQRAEAIEVDSSYFHSESMPFEEPDLEEIDENEPHRDIFQLAEEHEEEPFDIQDLEPNYPVELESEEEMELLLDSENDGGKQLFSGPDFPGFDDIID